MMIPVKIPVLFFNENDSRLIELGIKEEYECNDDIRIVIFYSITAISIYNHKNERYTCIHTPSQNFICPMSINEVEKLINTCIINK